MSLGVAQSLRIISMSVHSPGDWTSGGIAEGTGNSIPPLSAIFDERSLSHLRRFFSLGWGLVLPATDSLHGRPTGPVPAQGNRVAQLDHAGLLLAGISLSASDVVERGRLNPSAISCLP